MWAQDNKQPAAKDAPGPKPSVKIYSIFALQHDKAFVGEFETSKGNHKFTFAPASARVEKGKLELLGTFSLGNIGTRKVNVTATLVSTQGGLGAAPAAINARPADSPPDLPATEATGSRGFVGALYFQLSPIKASALGLRIDMSQVQLNARLFPTSDTERQLQVVFSDVVAALYGTTPNSNAAAPHLAALNQLL